MPTPTSPDSIQSLYNDHHGWLQGWLRRRLGNVSDAADLAHDVFVRVLGRHPPVAIREPRALLTTIAHGLVANLHRRRVLEQAYLEALASVPMELVPSEETRAIVLETLLEFDARLNRLPLAVRSVFLLSRLDGLAQAEIAARLGISIPTVKRYLARAIETCYFAD